MTDNGKRVLRGLTELTMTDLEEVLRVANRYYELKRSFKDSEAIELRKHYVTEAHMGPYSQGGCVCCGR